MTNALMYHALFKKKQQNIIIQVGLNEQNLSLTHGYLEIRLLNIKQTK